MSYPPDPLEIRENVQEAVVRDLEARTAFGVRKYGTPLTTNNGRDALLDAYEESLDLCCYLKQALLERKTKGGTDV